MEEFCTGTNRPTACQTFYTYKSKQGNFLYNLNVYLALCPDEFVMLWHNVFVVYSVLFKNGLMAHVRVLLNFV